jgi:lipopolysaccharide transport protein LptA
MAASNVNNILIVVGAVMLLSAALCAEPLKLTDPNLPVQLNAASTDFDYRKGVYNFHKVHISQGQLSVQAEESTANGTNINDSQWTFRGNVRIVLPNGHLESDSALVVFKNNQIASAHIVGTPATFETRRAQPEQIVRGKAGTIDYDITSGTVKLSDQASITDGQNEITGQTLVYDIAQQRVVANPGEQSDHGVSITINPRKPGEASKAPTTPTPTPGSAP